MSETDIMKSCLVALCKEYPEGLFIRRNIGAMQTNKGFIRFGMPGMADLHAIIEGMAIEIEIKTATGRQSEDQKNWQKAVEKAGGIYILTRSVSDCLEQVRRIIGGY